MDGVNLADFKTVMDNNGQWGGNNFIWFIFAILLFGGGFGGWGNRGQAATTEDLATGFSTSALQSKGNEILAAVNAEGRTTDNAICQLGSTMLQQFGTLAQQLSQCCCETQRAIDGVKFDMANYASAIQMNSTANAQKVLDKLCEMQMSQKDDKIAEQSQRIAALENQAALSAATCGIVRWPTQATYAVNCNPLASMGGCGCGCGYSY